MIRLGNQALLVNVIYLTIILLLTISHYDLSRSLGILKRTYESKRKDIESLRIQAGKLEAIKTRDFIRHDCKLMRRIGGFDSFRKNAPDPLYRIDGAWYVCFDKNLEPKNNSCLVLSFGVNDDYTFDQEMTQKHGCQVHSFDPFIEAPYFQTFRHMNPAINNSPIIEVTEKWKFYRIGVTGDNVRGENKNGVVRQTSFNSFRIGDILNLKSIIKLIGAYQRTIDVMKFDIEGEEWNVFMNMDMEYICKYVKQLMFETHKNFKFEELARLEKCFYLFYRHTRLFLGDVYGTPTGGRSEFQNGYKLDLNLFKNEISLAEYMFVNGEFYFVNGNFF